ncbi:hypothetical protein RhiirC2_801206 [Rhizophagus irregularis]|uniref:RNA-directed DNA polymerase from mobile element jockey-like n=1 Tax=Rhizophagus irregularis TaxID=588596 RepID=A0A2N1M2P1_9GLOM|nr:hypothetical protein RhiirC2_801206 [Rhizophagus irregularis]
MAKYHAVNQDPGITRISYRIDYIFGNNNILNGSIHTFTQPIPLSHFNSDHKAVITLLQNDLFKSTKLLNNHHRNDLKEKPNYSKMNEELWDEYEDRSRSYFKNRFRYIDLDNITTQEDLDHKEAIKHYQNIGKHENPLIYNSFNDLPTPWCDIYNPNNNPINNNCWNLLQQKIEVTDVINVLKHSPLNKAPSPSQITYKDLKHLHPDVLTPLTLIFNLCIHLDIIPSKWRDALLFLIPKPHDWDSNLTNTRPITLLETPRKLMIKSNTSTTQYPAV